MSDVDLRGLPDTAEVRSFYRTSRGKTYGPYFYVRWKDPAGKGQWRTITEAEAAVMRLRTEPGRAALIEEMEALVPAIEDAYGRLFSALDRRTARARSNDVEPSTEAGVRTSSNEKGARAKTDQD